MTIPHDYPAFIPLFTKRTKMVIRDIEPGQTRTIDVVDSQAPAIRMEVSAWLAPFDGQTDGFNFYDGPGNKFVRYQDIQALRDMAEAAPQVD